MASDEKIDVAELPARGGDDTPPLMSKVPEPPPSHWGNRTSGSRFESEAYLRFFYGQKKHKEVQRDG
jgi:hypothetical protein